MIHIDDEQLVVLQGMAAFVPAHQFAQRYGYSLLPREVGAIYGIRLVLK